MKFAVDFDNLVLVNAGEDCPMEPIRFENKKELLAFLCPPDWKPEDYEELYLYSLSQIPVNDMPFLPVKLFARFNALTRQRVYQLLRAGKLRKRGKLVQWKAAGDPVFTARRTLSIWEQKKNL